MTRGEFWGYSTASRTGRVLSLYIFYNTEHAKLLPSRGGLLLLCAMQILLMGLKRVSAMAMMRMWAEQVSKTAVRRAPLFSSKI